MKWNGLKRLKNGRPLTPATSTVTGTALLAAGHSQTAKVMQWGDFDSILGTTYRVPEIVNRFTTSEISDRFAQNITASKAASVLKNIELRALQKDAESDNI